MIVLVPAYEPDGRLLDLLDALAAAAPDLRVVVVDDGSGPAFRPLFDEARARGCTVLHHPANRGKGAALRTGFRHVAEHDPGEDVVCADSDGQHGVADVLRVAARVRDGSGLVLGARRFTGAVPARSRLGNTATRQLYRLATGRSLADTQTGLRGYPAALLPWLLEVPGERFEYEFNVLLRAPGHGHPITEVPISTVYLDGNASSHFRPLVDSARIYAPLLAFLLSSLGAFLLDTAALVGLHGITGGLVLSVVGARVLSSSVNFLVNRHVVFADARVGGAARAARRYAALAVLLLAGNVVLMTALTAAGLPLLAAKLATEATLVTVSYAVQNRVVFTGRRSEPVPVEAPALARR